MSGRHSIVSTGPLSSSNPLPPPPSVHPPSVSHLGSHNSHSYHQSPGNMNSKTQGRPGTGRSSMMHADGPSGDGYRSDMYAREKDREREMERDRQERSKARNRDGGRHNLPPFHSNGHISSHPGPTTRHPLDITHSHPSSHLPPPPGPAASNTGHPGRESRSHPHRQSHNGPGPSSVNQAHNQMVVSSGANAMGSTAAQIHAAIVKGTEGPFQALAQANEQTWLLIGAVSEQLSDTGRALVAYENALKHNPMSVSALTQVAGIARSKEEFGKAIDYYQRTLNISQENGEVWGSLGHCYLMMDDLQKAYTAYQQALYRLPNPKDSKLWYGIGILYDRYGSLEHAEEAFSSVLRMEPEFEKANEIYFRLGIIYKQQHKYPASLECFRYILGHPPRPLTEVDIWFQIGHVYEQQKDYGAAKEAYERVLKESPNHAKVLQQLGWLYHQGGASFANQDSAISYLTKSLEADPADPQSWYLLGRAFMGGQKFNKAYEAYQQAVYRDGRNPTFWCSIGVLYYQINQYRDALDAYSRAIRLNPYISEVWFDLGTLYESCNNQINDAIDAYARASDLDPTNQTIKSRLSLLRNAQRDGQPLPAPPPTQDVHPTAYGSTAAGGRQFHAPGGPGGHLPYESHAVDGMPVINGRDLAAPPPPQAAPLPASAFRGGGGPPPLQLDDMRNPAAHNTPLAPMTVDRNPGNDSAMNRGGPQGHMNNAEERRRAPLSPPPAGRHRGEPARGPQGGSADWDPRRRDVWEDREPAGRRGSRSDKFSGPGPSYRTSPAPSLNRGSPVIPPARQAWDPRHEALGHGGRTPAHEAIDRRVSGGSDNRGPGHMNGQVFDRRMEMEQPPRSRPGSPPRYAPDSRETERYRNDERSWREHDARLREEAEKRARPGARDHFLPESRPLAGSMRSPASVHVAPQAESAKKKRKSRGASPERVSPRGSTSSKDKKPTNESLGSPPSARVLDDVERRSPFAGSRAASPSAPKVAASPIRAAPVPRQSGRIIDEDYDEGAADALMGLAGYRGTKEANGTSYIPISRAASEARAETLPPPSLPTESTAGHKRTISGPEDHLGSDYKKARLSSPARAEVPAIDKQTASSVNPSAEIVIAAASEATTSAAETPVSTADKPEQEVVNGSSITTAVIHPPSPKSPEADVIMEAVSGETIPVQTDALRAPSVPPVVAAPSEPVPASADHENSDTPANPAEAPKSIEPVSAETSSAEQVTTAVVEKETKPEDKPSEDAKEAKPQEEANVTMEVEA